MASGEAEVGRGKGDADAPAQPLGDLAATDLIDVCIQQVHVARISMYEYEYMYIYTIPYTDI